MTDDDNPVAPDLDDYEYVQGTWLDALNRKEVR